MGSSEDIEAAGPTTPWGFARLVKPALARLDGVVRLGGPRRWWLLGGHAPAVSVFFDDDDRLHIEVQVISGPGADARALGRQVQAAVLAEVRRTSNTPVESIDVFITPKP